MKSDSANLHHFFKSIFLATFAVIGLTHLGYAQQDSDLPKLTLITQEDGFNGVYAENGKSYTIENRESQDAFRTRIVRPDGSLLVESNKEAGVVNVLLPTGKLRLDIANPSNFSPAETRAVEEFSRSSDCTVVKKIVMEIFKKRASEKPSLLGGFRVIAMLLGE